MLTKLVCKLGCKVAANPAILVEAAPILVPVVAVAAVYDAVEYFRK